MHNLVLGLSIIIELYNLSTSRTVWCLTRLIVQWRLEGLLLLMVYKLIWERQDSRPSQESLQHRNALPANKPHTVPEALALVSQDQALWCLQAHSTL